MIYQIIRSVSSNRTKRLFTCVDCATFSTDSPWRRDELRAFWRNQRRFHRRSRRTVTLQFRASRPSQRVCYTNINWMSTPLELTL